MEWTEAWWALFLVPVALRLLGARKANWTGPLWLDLVLGALLGLGLAWLKLHAIAPALHGDEFSWYISDSIKVCSTVEYIQTGETEGIIRHPGGLIPVALLRGWLGLLGGLAAGSYLSSALHTALLYYLGTLIHSRMAGFVAALFSCAVAPLAFMPVHLNHYPEATAVYLLATTLGVLAWMVRGSLAPLLAGLGAGLALFIDFGGVAVAAPIMLLGLVKWAGSRRGARLAGGIGLVLPIILSWVLARQVTPPDTSPFEEQVEAMLRDARARVPNWVARDRASLLGILPEPSAWRPPDWVVTQLPDPSNKENSYLWGYSTPYETVRSTLRVAQMSLARVPVGLEHSVHGEQLDQERVRELSPWMPLYVASVVIMIFGLRRRPIFLLGLLLLFAPYASALGFQARVRVWISYLMMPLSPLPLAFGLAWAVLALRPSLQDGAPRGRWERLRRATVVCVSVLALGSMVASGMPSHISPSADWRTPRPFVGRAFEARSLLEWFDQPASERPETARTGSMSICMKLLNEDYAAGHDPHEALDIRIVRWPIEELR